MKPLIAITPGEIYNQIEPWSPVTYGQSSTYVEAIVHAGGTPFIIPITADEHVLRQLYEVADGILFAGGNDPDPKLYGEEPYSRTVGVSHVRDTLDLQLMRWALEDKKPFLGICRGMQLLNIIKGGTLYQDIPTDLPEAVDHDSSSKLKSLEDIAHILNIQSGSKLAEILQTTHVGANTHHHQGIKKLGDGLVATAWSEDGVIEAIEPVDRSQFALGVQSHPESLEAKAETVWQRFFNTLVEEAGR
jgi:putative glutamine amidotransferase